MLSHKLAVVQHCPRRPGLSEYPCQRVQVHKHDGVRPGKPLFAYYFGPASSVSGYLKSLGF